MNIWTLEFEEKWSYQDEWMQYGLSFTVAAKNSDEAISKAKKLVKIGKRYKDEEDGSYFWLEEVRLIGLKRGATIDG